MKNRTNEYALPLYSLYIIIFNLYNIVNDDDELIANLHFDELRYILSTSYRPNFMTLTKNIKDR